MKENGFIIHINKKEKITNFIKNQLEIKFFKFIKDYLLLALLYNCYLNLQAQKQYFHYVIKFF